MTLAFIRNSKLQLFFPFFLAFLLTIPFLFMLPDLFPKYRAELVESGFIDKAGGFEYYEDLDHDGFSEKIVLFNNVQNEVSIKIMEADGSIGEQYYFRGQILKDHTACSFSDFDSTGITRIFLFSLSHDSLLLHCVDPVREKRAIIRNKFIATVIPKEGVYDFQIHTVLFEDMNDDGNRELITTIMTGFTLKPRIAIMLDIAGRSVACSPIPSVIIRTLWLRGSGIIT